MLTRPFVIGELVLGGHSAREEALFERLPGAATLAHDEVLEFVRRRRLTRRGIGWVDAHLLASTFASSAELWSIATDLRVAAADLTVAFQPG